MSLANLSEKLKDVHIIVWITFLIVINFGIACTDIACADYVRTSVKIENAESLQHDFNLREQSLLNASRKKIRAGAMLKKIHMPSCLSNFYSQPVSKNILSDSKIFLLSPINRQYDHIVFCQFII